MENLLIIAVVAVVIAAALGYIIRERRKGVKCIGCPNSKDCAASKKSSDCCSCGCCSAKK